MLSSHFVPLGKKIGIIGGGQLARMLVHAGQCLGLEMHILSEHKSDPAAQVTSFWSSYSKKNFVNDLKLFAKDVDVLTFESEFHNIDDVRAAADKKNLFVYPNFDVMEKIQDRRTQKLLLQKYKIPTSPFAIINHFNEIENAWSSLTTVIPASKKAVLKIHQGGYDGNGTFVVSSLDELKNTFLKLQKPCILEKFFPFEKELAIIFARSKAGSFISLPLVETVQKDHRCDLVSGPFKLKSGNAIKEVTIQFRKLMEKENYVGVLAAELFYSKGKLLINELAPRVHNSGHYTMDALSHSQFALHILSGISEKLPNTNLKAPFFVMSNLVGETSNLFQIPSSTNVTLHWYGKTENRKGRKMGHINYVGNDLRTLVRLAKGERAKCKK